MPLLYFSILCLIALHQPTLWAQKSSQAKISVVQKYIDEAIKKRRCAGMVVYVRKGDQTVHFSADGYQDIKEKLPMQQQSIFRIYSMTKPITTVAAMQLAEQNLIQLDDPIHQYIPELKNLKVIDDNPSNDAGPISIRDLMRHTAGFSYGFFSQTKVDKLYLKNHPLYTSNNQDFIDKVAQLPLLHAPGKKYHYSIATDILGVLIERVSQKSLDDYFKENILTPLNMKDTDFFIPSDKIDRFCSSYKPDLSLKESYKQNYFVENQQYVRESGGGGLVSTAADYMAFCMMLKNGGIYKGQRILQQESIESMTKNQLIDDDVAYKGIGFGLGFSVQLEEWGVYGHRGDYAWSGAASTYFFVSPKEDLAVVILTQIQPFTNQFMKELKPLILKAVQKKRTE